MRFNEFQIKEQAYLRARLKETHPHLTEEQLDEIAPLAALGAGAAKAGAMGARVAGKATVAGAKVAGKVGAKAAKMGAKAAGQAGKALAKGAGNAVAGAGKQVAGAVAKGLANKVTSMAANKLLKPGKNIPVGGGEMKVAAVKGNEVTVADPKDPKAPKVVLQKNDPAIKGALNTMMGNQ